MPKMKTKSGAKKRFRVTSTGKVKFQQSNKRHLLMNRPKSMKRKAKGTDTMFRADGEKVLKNFMPYQRGRRKIVRARAKADSAAKGA